MNVVVAISCTAAVLACGALTGCGRSKAAVAVTPRSPVVPTSSAAASSVAASGLNSPAGVLAALVPPVRGLVPGTTGTVGGMNAAALDTFFGTQPGVAFAAATVYTGSGGPYAVVAERFTGTLTAARLMEIMGHDIGLAPEISVSDRDQGTVVTMGGASVTVAVLQTDTTAVVVEADVPIELARAVASQELAALAKAA